MQGKLYFNNPNFDYWLIMIPTLKILVTGLEMYKAFINIQGKSGSVKLGFCEICSWPCFKIKLVTLAFIIM